MRAILALFLSAAAALGGPLAPPVTVDDRLSDLEMRVAKLEGKAAPKGAACPCTPARNCGQPGCPALGGGGCTCDPRNRVGGSPPVATTGITPAAPVTYKLIGGVLYQCGPTGCRPAR